MAKNKKHLIDEENIPKIQFCIPPLGTQIVLAKNWEFKLWYERRNDSLIKNMNIDVTNVRYGHDLGYINLPKGTILSVDRIYIRKGYRDYNSVTFRIKKCSHKEYEKSRFWAKLNDVNKIICFPIGIDTNSINITFGRMKDISAVKDFKYIELE
ncbi:MAG: hypothetical protein ACOC56_04615 [Atribacterota bacterium]